MFGSSKIKIKPSEILFSQESIGIYFDDNNSHFCKQIGETLDDLCEERCSISNIPSISVMKLGDRWVTTDNRRLWVFQNLERLGRCDSINASIVSSKRPGKPNSTNGGETVRVRGDPGGTWHLQDGHTNRPNGSSHASKGIWVAGAALLWWMISR